MKKQILSLAVVSTLGLGVIAGPEATASTLSDLKNKQNQIHNERSGVNSDIKKAETEIGQLQGEQRRIEQEIQKLDNAIEDANNKIREKNVQIQDTRAQIEKLKVEIDELIERIEKRNQLLKDRARSFQENGGTVSYIDVLLGAQSFSDFIDRVSAVSTIMEADKDILEQHRKDKQLLEEKQKQVENQLKQLEQMLKDLEGLKAKLSNQKAAKDKLMASLKEKEENAHAHKLSLQEEEQMLAAQEAAMKKAIALEQERMAREAEAARQRELAKQRSSKSGGSSSGGSGGGGGAPASAPKVSSGTFTKPANGRLSSGFGSRGGSFHYGVDIANRGSNVPIVAAADGYVIRSYYSSSYGNAIFISHSINGKIYTTVYAHMQTRLVNGGAVSKGQIIGYMGNTGQSFGQHLHFELHKGPWTSSKSNAINPVGIVPL